MDLQKQTRLVAGISVALGLVGAAYWALVIYSVTNPPAVFIAPGRTPDWRILVAGASLRDYGALQPAVLVLADLQLVISLVQIVAGAGTLQVRRWGPRLLTWATGLKWLFYAVAAVMLGTSVFRTRPADDPLWGQGMATFFLNALVLVFYSWAFNVLTRPARRPATSEEPMV